MTTQTVGTNSDYSTRAGRLRLALRMAREAENIGGRIKELREGQKMTQRELADQLPGKTEGKDISRWENGKHRPSPDTLAAIAKILGTTVADLHAGPIADRKEKGPTPDPFASQAATAGVDAAEILQVLQDLKAGQVELAAKVLKVEKSLEALHKQQRPAARPRKAKG